jgi:hypothetical protein
MVICCPRCDRIFDTDREDPLDPHGLVCGRCVEAMTPEGLDTAPPWVKPKPIDVDHQVELTEAQADAICDRYCDPA